MEKTVIGRKGAMMIAAAMQSIDLALREKVTAIKTAFVLVI